MSKGESRVGISFNPSGIQEVDHIKHATSELIDLLEVVKENNVFDNQEVSRCASIAQTKFEEAAMWAVKAITKPKE